MEAECREEKGQRGKAGIEIENQKEIFDNRNEKYTRRNQEWIR